MPEKKDIRWKQRAENYFKALELLKDALAIDRPSRTERGGIIQFFEVTVELAWKLLKDVLDYEGIVVKSPRETILKAYQLSFIEEGELWLLAVQDRNLTVHTYDESKAEEIEAKIRNDYYPLLVELKQWILNRK